jgi:F420H(2)-dependent biliverdin reductase
MASHPDHAAALRSRTAWLTTLRTDGSPHTTPIWFVADGERIWMASSTVNRKVQHLAADPRASLSIDGTGSAPQVAEGTVTIHDLAGREPIVAALAAKYVGWDPTDEAQDGPRVLLELDVRRWLLGGPGRR